MDERPQTERPIDEQPVTLSRGLRCAIISSATILPVVFCILLKPTAAQAAWTTFTHIIQIEGRASATKSLDISNVNLASFPPQQQAELLLNAAVNQLPGATEAIFDRASSWRGRLRTTPELSGLLDRALNSPDLNVRAGAIETELATNNLAKTGESVSGVIRRVNNEPPVRPWGLWMLGALGNRGVEASRVLATLTTYTRDSDDKTRYWAVEGLSVLGSNDSIQPLLGVLRNDPSETVRNGAASALAKSGMLTREQRFRAVPPLIEAAGDSSLGTDTHELAFRALRNITGNNIDNDPAAWRSWWATHGEQ